MKKILGIMMLVASFTATGTQAQEWKQETNNMSHSLTPQEQCLSAIACLEAKGDMTALEKEINAGLDAGLPIGTIREALSQLYAYTGFPRSLNALGVLQRVAETRKAEGKTDEEGKEPSPLDKTYNALAHGTEVQTKLSGAPFNYSFAPATDYYLKAHLFGDIFARDNMSHAERELVTVSALSALEGCEPQLIAHLRGARNMGLREATIQAIPEVLEKRVGTTEAWRLRCAIKKADGEQPEEMRPLDKPDFPQGAPNEAYAQYFIGDSYLAVLNEGKVPVSNVTFEPRCRNNWHIHHDCIQMLVCVKGRGWYQEWGKEARELKAGDVVEIPSGVKHWHGATRNNWFQHVVFHVDDGPNPKNEWCEPVSDVEYDKLP